MEKITEVWIGVDVSKKTLDIYIHPIGKFFKINNSEEGLEKFIKELLQYDIKQIACEATGGYEKLLATILKKHDYPLWIVDPRRIKGFIVASGCKSKNDKIDAKKIAEFAAKNSPEYKSINKTENQILLQAFTNRRKDLVQFLASEKVRLQHPSHVLCIASIQTLIETLEGHIESIDLQIQDIIKQDEELNKKSKFLESIPGIGKATAAVLLSSVPELGTLKGSQISALVGLCPYENSSGSYTGKRFIRGGRVTPRNALYMCALTTIKHHLPLKAFYDRLRENKKPFKVAIVAVMRKLIVIANAILRRGELCQVYN